MKIKKRILLMSIVLVICAAFIVKLSYSGAKNDKDIESEVIKFDDKNVYVIGSNTDETTIKPGDTIEENPYVVNSGDTDCYVRVKLVIPQINEESIFKVGTYVNSKFIETFSDDSFVTLNNSSIEKEYWEKSGDYIYYKNSSTGNKLLAGSKTKEIYQAVRLNTSVTAENLSQINDFDILIYVESVSSSDSGSLEGAFK